MSTPSDADFEAGTGSRSESVRFVFVYEFSRSEDWMMDTLISALQKRIPGFTAAYVNGLFKTYKPGGFQIQRIANLLWVYLEVAIRLIFSRYDGVMVRTTPPGVQLWTIAWARIRNVPVYCWLMDYHPEIEARYFEKKGYRRISGALRALDAAAMRQFRTIVVLDRAMANLARSRAADVTILEHPTWGAPGGGFEPVSYPIGGDRREICLVYAGNLGVAHDISTLRKLLRELRVKRQVRLHVVGCSVSGNALFAELSRDLNLALEAHPRVSFDRLRSLYEQWKVDAGIVLLSESSAGLVSPSKFSGYITFGLPLIYIGPADTNSAEICCEYDGGFWLSPRATDEDIELVSKALGDEAQMRKKTIGAASAAAYFLSRNGETLAEALIPIICETPAADQLTSSQRSITAGANSPDSQVDASQSRKVRP